MSKQLHEAYIVAATRTPIGKAGRGVFRHMRPDDLLVAALQGLLAQVPELHPALIEDAIIGCAMPEAAQGMNVARVATLLAGLPDSVAGMTVNRFCASGLSALQIAADRIRCGEAEIILAGGVESMSAIPMGGHAPSFNPAIFQRDENIGIAYGMGLTAERVASRWKVSREAQDAFALASHRKALEAISSGAFAQETTPVQVSERHPDLRDNGVAGSTTERSFTVHHDEGPREDTSLEALARLKPQFSAGGSVTAGNSSQTSDGAGALLLASGEAVRKYGLTPLARCVSFAACGVAPDIMGIGPAAAIPLALQRAGLRLEDLDWIELNEAFAAQAIAVIDSVGLDPSRVNPLGGAIALGHPLGASGAIRSATLVHGLRRTKGRYGMLTMCVGTGQGAAAIIESL